MEQPIDGTVEGTDIMTGHIDSNIGHDHTYFGNGCSNEWGQDGAGGSSIACATNILQTGDGEDQINGAYYSYQAATSGSGSKYSTDNEVVPDTFCPLGWQMPYSGTGGDYYNQPKSWIYLFAQYGSLLDPSTGLIHYRHDIYPLSYIKPGGYYNTSGRFYYQGGHGYNWSNTITYIMQNSYTDNIKFPTASKAFSYTIRCI